MRNLNVLEKRVLEKLVEGNEPGLDSLRAQLRSCVVTAREMTGVGFLTSLHVKGSAARLPLSQPFRLGGVAAEIEGLDHGAGFILFLENGLLETLEGFSFDEPWPKSEARFELRYSEEREQDLEKLGKELAS